MTFPIPSQQIVLFLLPFAITSFIGVVSYVLVRLGYDKMPDFLEIVSFPCTLLLFLLVLFWLFLSVFLVSLLIPLILLLSLSFLGAYADRAISTEQDTFSWHHWRICVGVITSLVLALLLYVVLDEVSGTFGVMNSSSSFAGCLAGLMAGPIVAPIFIWLWRSSQMRPGIDRHLNSSEELSSRS